MVEIPDFSVEWLFQRTVGRAFNYPPLLYLVAVNLLVLGAAHYFGWDQGELLLLYWSETAVIGFFTGLKILLAKPSPESKGDSSFSLQKASSIFFLLVHFTTFMLVYLFCLVMFFKVGGGGAPFGVGLFVSLAVTLFPGFAVFFTSHALSFWFDYVKGGEMNGASLELLIFQPYVRVFPMHLAIVLGFAVSAPFLVLGIAKTFFDMLAYFIERQTF